MFARLFAVASLAALAVAGPGPLFARNQCNTGSLNCCNSVQDVKTVRNLLGPIVGGVAVLADVTGTVGMTCSPISIVSASSGGCTQQTACCSGDKFYGGLVQAGCDPINLGA